MSPLTIEVVDTERQVRSKYVFERSPVRFGRSPLNDLPLDRPFVSHCHGVLHFDAQRCDLIDLGSTNGTYVDERRIAKNHSTQLADGQLISIGALRLSIRRGDAVNGNTRTSYAFRPSAINVEGARTPTPNPDGSANPSLDASAAASHELADMHAQYRLAWRTLMSAVARNTPPGADREQVAAELMGRFPELAQESEFRRWAGTSTAPTPSQAPVSAQSAHLRSVVERFVQAFVELRHGQEQVARQLSLPCAESPLPSSDPQKLLLYLTDSRHPERIDDLSRACADLMLHQIALVNAMSAGARSLLEEFAPAQLAATARGVVGWLGRVVGQDGRWHAFTRRYEDLREDGALSSVLFGKAFARAYADAIGGKRPDESEYPRQTTGPLDSRSS